MSLDIYNSTIDQISFSQQGIAFLYYSNSNSWYAKYATSKIGRNKIMLLFVLAQPFPTHREEFMWESRISYNKVIQIVGNGQKVRLGLDPLVPGIPGGVPYLKENCFHLASCKARIRYVDPACFGGFCRRPSSNDVLTTHASCYVEIAKKLHDLRLVLEEWRNFTALSVDNKRRQNHAWRAPSKCRTR